MVNEFKKVDKALKKVGIELNKISKGLKKHTGKNYVKMQAKDYYLDDDSDESPWCDITTSAAIICAMIVFTIFILGFAVMITLGSYCIANKANEEKVHQYCGSFGGAVAMVAVGGTCLLSICGIWRIIQSSCRRH
jgi:hypothetical protein